MEHKRLKRAVLLLLVVCLLCTSVSAKEVRLVPSGETIGIHVDASGLLVVGISEVETEHGLCSPAWEAGMRIGDFIVAIGAQEVTTIQELRSSLASADGDVAVRFLRDGREMQLTVRPIYGQEGEGELGLWLRTGISGLGTLTFIEPETKSFGALGHGVSDGDTGVLLPLKEGSIGEASVDSIHRGERGKPGELKGGLGLDTPIGSITQNTSYGIYGTITMGYSAGGEAVCICPLQALHCGPAVILSDVSGALAAYQVEISRIYPDGSGGRDLLITVTDSDLIRLTGGIVQGMSGSPILQDGCLAGAVTHVLVNDPTRGYGIGIERMLNTAA